MHGQTTTHASFLARLKDGGDSTAWPEFNERYGELIRSFARRRGLQPSDCDDVYQDVLLSLARAMPGFSYDPSRGKFRSYLKTATLRVIFKRSRQNPGGVNLEDIENATRAAETDAAVEEAWEMEWRQYHLRQAVPTIEVEFSHTDRQAFQRYAVEGMGARETAEALELSVDQVYQAKSRITKRLAELIGLQVQEEG